MEESDSARVSETDIRFEELKLERRRVAIAEKEFDLKANTASMASWRNPLVIAVMAAVIAGLGNAAVSHLDGKREREIELTKAEHTRILEMINVDSPDKAAENLTFLIDAGLIMDPDMIDNIQSYLNTREDGKGVSTAVSLAPRTASGVVGSDDRVVVPDPSIAPYRSICQVSYRQKGMHMRSTAVLMEDGIVLSTATHRFVEDFTNGTISCGRSGNQSIVEGARPIKSVVYIDTPIGGHYYALFSIGNLPTFGDFRRIPITAEDPKPSASVQFAAYPIEGPEGQRLNGMVMMETQTEIVVVDDKDGLLYHYGDTGGGTGGGPLFRRNGDDFELLAIHHFGDRPNVFGKTAFRIPSVADYDDAVAELRQMDAAPAGLD